MSEAEEAVQLPPHDHLLKLILVGDSGVGKTSLLLRFIEDSFSENTTATMGIDFKHTVIEVDGKKIALRIWDTAGQERFRTISGTYYKGAHGIVIVYDVTDDESFTSCRTWLSEIDRYMYSNPDAKKILVGNKIDLESTRKLKASVAEEFAEKFEMKFFETSAKESVNVSQVFTALTREILESGVTGTGGPVINRANTGETIQIRSAARGSKDSTQEGGKGKCCAKN